MKLSGVCTPLFLCLAAMAAPMAHAHDYWIQADPYVADKPTQVAISLHVGQDLVGESQPNIANWYQDFSYIHQGTRKPMPGNMGDDPAGRLPADQPGLYLVGYENHADHIILKPAKFNAYLEQEGLQAIAKQRQANGQADQAGREYYQRCAKNLIRIGHAPVAQAELKQRFDYRLEIIPLSNPYEDDELQVQLQFDGQPQADLLLIAFTRAEPDQKQNIRTDTQGRASIKLDRDGEWLIKTVHMIPYTKDSDADWISFWASLTFKR